jgi:hypothetical protein
VPSQTLRRSWSQEAGIAIGRPVVVPTRRRIDRRFPSLGFTVSSHAPYVELLLTTDPANLDPARASFRTETTWYASRTTGGLTPTVSGRARYVLPASVVERLVTSGDSIWYLAIAYPDATGTGGTTSTEHGATGAVTVDPSFRRGTTRNVRALALIRSLSLGIGVDDRCEGEDGADIVPGSPAVSLGRRQVRALNAPNAIADRLDGEDGVDVPPMPSVVVPATPVDVPGNGQPGAASPGAPTNAAVANAGPTVGSPPSNGHVIGTPPAPGPSDGGLHGGGGLNGGAPVNGNGGAVAALAEADYEDGWDGWDTWEDAGKDGALGAAPALGDEYPDIDWGGVGIDRYGSAPTYRGLDDGTAGDVARTGKTIVLPGLDLAAEVQRRIIELTTGADGAGYAAINADGPFRGRHGPGHKAFQHYHTGLSFGIAEFNQDNGTLGQLLTLMHQRDAAEFAAIFGAGAAELLAVTTAPGPSGEHVGGDRGPRVQPVAGADLWEEPWLSRFRAAGASPAFRAAQNQLAAELYLGPMLTVAAGFGLDTERALCMVLDRAIVLGEQGAKRWIADTVGPARTHALRQTALAALGHDTIESFQASVPGLLTDGEFGPVTHATLTAALRSLGAQAPIPVLTTQQMIDEMAIRAGNEDGSARLVRLAHDAGPGDVPLGG